MAYSTFGIFSRAKLLGLFLSPCARSLIARLISVTSQGIGDVKETNRTQAPKQQTSGNYTSRTRTGQMLQHFDESGYLKTNLIN